MQKPPVAIREFKKPKDMNACPMVRFTHDAEGVLALNCDGYVVLWDSESTKLLKTAQLPKGHYFPSVWMSPDRRFAAVGGNGCTYFIDTATLKATVALPFSADDLSWSKNGEFVAAVNGNWDTFKHEVHVLRTADRKQIASFELPKHSTSPEFWGGNKRADFFWKCGHFDLECAGEKNR